jgi:hypothetical protein
MRDDANDYTVGRHLEAYLLSLFGHVMSCGSQGGVVSKYLILYARMIAEADVDGRDRGRDKSCQQRSIWKQRPSIWKC